MNKSKICIALLLLLAAVISVFSCNLVSKTENIDNSKNNAISKGTSSKISEEKDEIITSAIVNDNIINEVSNDQIHRENNHVSQNEETVVTPSKPSISEDLSNKNKQESSAEKMVTIKEPIYSINRVYWIKDGDTYIWSGTSYSAQQEYLESLTNDAFAKATYGSCGPNSLSEHERKKYISNYNVYTMTESEYLDSAWIYVNDCEVIYDE